MPWRFLHMEAHFELVKANFIRCEECNENFFFDFLRHPRYFVTHFKSCHLKNLLYRFNGQSEEENARVRFGPRRKKDANHWFGQLKSTEKRMISMQDNKWSEISERDCWSCRLCNDGKADLTHVFELTELGRGHAFLHLRQAHERAFDDFRQRLPSVQSALELELQQTPLRARSTLSTAPTISTNTSTNSAGPNLVLPTSSCSHHVTLTRPTDTSTDDISSGRDQPIAGTTEDAVAAVGGSHVLLGDSSAASVPLDATATAASRSLQQRMAEAERSRLRRLRASAEVRHVEAQRSKRRRERLTPVQRQADYDRRKRKKKRQDEQVRSRKRRELASDATREREQLRSRERRRLATDDQRKREAERSRRRRENASDEQRLRERERCRKRYEIKKQRSGTSNSGTSQYASSVTSSRGAASDDNDNDDNDNDGFAGNQSSAVGSDEYRDTDEGRYTTQPLYYYNNDGDSIDTNDDDTGPGTFAPVSSILPPAAGTTSGLMAAASVAVALPYTDAAHLQHVQLPTNDLMATEARVADVPSRSDDNAIVAATAAATRSIQFASTPRSAAALSGSGSSRLFSPATRARPLVSMSPALQALANSLQPVQSESAVTVNGGSSDTPQFVRTVHPEQLQQSQPQPPPSGSAAATENVATRSNSSVANASALALSQRTAL